MFSFIAGLTETVAGSSHFHTKMTQSINISNNLPGNILFQQYLFYAKEQCCFFHIVYVEKTANYIFAFYREIFDGLMVNI